jgi:hypothetical protein
MRACRRLMMNSAAWAAVVVTLSVLPPRPTSAQFQQSGGATFRSGVEMVVLTVTVEQGTGGYLDGLEASDFRIDAKGPPRRLPSSAATACRRTSC